ncbi:MAG: arsenate reductase ArsC [Sulfitobacter sp.]|nr:arsenate reductase ArsC [Sulfitobacter sp.]
MNILVLCTGNSARSILLESLLNHLGGGRVTAYSAGSQPAGKVNPHSIALLSAKGHDTSGFRSKSWDEFAGPDAPKMAAVITVCGSAAEETCPIWPGAPVRAHWGVEDPAAASDDAAPAAFAEAYGILKRRAEAFLAAPVETMDNATLTAHLNSCAAVQ